MRPEEYLRSYEGYGFKAIPLKGYSPRYNQESGPEKRYKEAKTPTHAGMGFTKPDYVAPTAKQCLNLIENKQWIGHLLPPGTIAIDAEDPDKISWIDSRLPKGTPVSRTNKGKHYLFSDGGNVIAGADNSLTRTGFSVTYRTGGRNYLILPPTNDRTWITPMDGKPYPGIPDEFLPIRKDDPIDWLMAASWELGTLRSNDQLRGWNPVTEYFGGLCVAGLPDETLHECARRIWRQDYHAEQTQKEVHRIRRRIEGGEPVRGLPSFIRRLQESGDTGKTLLDYVITVARLMGVKEEPTRIQPDEWADPVPLPMIDTVDFPMHCLPDWGREICESVTDISQVDGGLTAGVFLSILSCCLAQKARVVLPSHEEPVNLYVCSVADSGSRKSGVFDIMTTPLYRYEEEQQISAREAVQESKNLHETLNKRIQKLQNKAANCDDRESRYQIEAQIREVIRERIETPEKTLPVYVCDDVTTERLCELMAENESRMSLFSPEGGVFGILAGRYSSDKTNFDIFLKGHPGDNISVHRIGRESLHMRRPALTVCLGVQPEVINEVGQNKAFRGRGLLARFLYVMCRQLAGYRTLRTGDLPCDLLDRYSERIYDLMRLPVSEAKLYPDSEATTIWGDFYNHAELALRPDGEYSQFRDWGSKLPGAVARIAALCHMAQFGREGYERKISGDTMIQACAIGGYFGNHAAAAFGHMRLLPAMETARKIIRYVQRQNINTFNSRDVMRNTHIMTADEVNEGIRVLIDRGFMREKTPAQGTGGRPTSPVWEVNPKCPK